MAKVLLVQPHEDLTKKYERARTNTPITLIILGTAIKNKHEVKIYDRNFNANDKKFIEFLQSYNPDIVGFTSMTAPMLFDLMRLGKLVKKILPKTIVIVGGVHASVEPDSVLNEPYVDYIIRGEGDEAFLEFCDTFDKNPKKLGKLKNINKNPLRPFVDLEKLEVPDFDLVDLKKYDHVIVMLSRGCTGNCTFCCSTRRWGINGKPCVRTYKTEKIIQFFKDLIEKHKVKTFSIADDNFLSLREQTFKICKYLEGKDAHFFCFARADDIDDEMLEMLKKAGCHTIQIGIESGSQRVLDFLNKKITVQQNIKAIECCKRNGITCDASFMTGLPTENVEELNMTKAFVKKHKPDIPNAKIFCPLPGAPLFDFCVTRGLLKKPETLREWADWTGEITFIKTRHNTSKIPDNYLVKTTRDIVLTGFYRNKLRRLVYWTKAGEFRHVLNSVRRLFVWRGDNVILSLLRKRD
jgi:radical SAM superfamily enzyme YgiQ (UPF0313 family)